MARERQKTMRFFSDGRVEVSTAKPGTLNPRSGKTLKLPALTAQAAEAVLNDTPHPHDDEIPSNVRLIDDPVSASRLRFDDTADSLFDGEDNFLTNSQVEAILGISADNSRSDDVQRQTPGDSPDEIDPTETCDEEEIVPSRPAMLDLTAFVKPPAEPTPEIKKTRREIGNKARIAIAIGVGVALGLAGTALYSEYYNGQSQKPNTEKPAPENNGV